MTEYHALRTVLDDVLLLEPDEFRLDLSRREVETWDSVGQVFVANAIETQFAIHASPDEWAAVDTVADVIELLGRHGVQFEAADASP